jgi:hypothetical protein
MPSDSDEARQNAKNIDDYRLRVIHERWLSTLILTIHLEIETLLVELLRAGLLHSQKFLGRKNLKPSFAQKLVACEAAGLIDDDIAEGVWAVNRLRNELAHRLDDVPSVDALARFIAAMSAMHPLQFRSSPASPLKTLRTFQQIRAHFLKINRDEVEHFVFISLLLLKAKLSVLVKTRKAKPQAHE